MEINYFGKPYSFTHVAAIRRFGNDHDYISRISIGETIEVIRSRPNAIAVVPIENTTGGIIHDTVDELCQEINLESNIVVKEELELLIRLFLLSKEELDLSQIRKVYSHEYALKSSDGWIKANLPKTVQQEKITSTSEGILKIQEEEYSCAIASAEAAKHYGLIQLAEIEVNGKQNITRFFVLGKNGESKLEY